MREGGSYEIMKCQIAMREVVGSARLLETPINGLSLLSDEARLDTTYIKSLLHYLLLSVTQHIFFLFLSPFW